MWDINKGPHSLVSIVFQPSTFGILHTKKGKDNIGFLTVPGESKGEDIAGICLVANMLLLEYRRLNAISASSLLDQPETSHQNSSQCEIYKCQGWVRKTQQRNRMEEKAARSTLDLKPDSSVPPCMSLVLFKLLPCWSSKHRWMV
ncbi:uncharacterized protein LOC120612231 [Pteropus medius]|uniref:uncharacterized protein LOC120612231 n=1 Tax=Pteropus vampyrus TaxID=132908 RepID=UPI00196A9BCD|nr:uncharacterized protein LOC120612231 [Pteropus giganteus]